MRPDSRTHWLSLLTLSPLTRLASAAPRLASAAILLCVLFPPPDRPPTRLQAADRHHPRARELPLLSSISQAPTSPVKFRERLVSSPTTGQGHRQLEPAGREVLDFQWRFGPPARPWRPLRWLCRRLPGEHRDFHVDASRFSPTPFTSEPFTSEPFSSEPFTAIPAIADRSVEEPRAVASSEPTQAASGSMPHEPGRPSQPWMVPTRRERLPAELRAARQ